MITCFFAMSLSHPSLFLVSLFAIAMGLGLVSEAKAQDNADPDAQFIRDNYDKREHRIPMRDGVRLFTSVYTPKDTSVTVPILMMRTPYSVAPYGEDKYPSQLGPSMSLARDGFIFVYQDVRGRMMSEGEFEAVRPFNPDKQGMEIDEASDTYDTVEWLLENIPGNNGRVGAWGISAPGFYATQALLADHPAILAVSPQAPVTDWWLGDDRHHNGAFQLQASFSFLSFYGTPRPEPTTEPASGFSDYGTPDGYRWYREQGPLSTFNERYLHGENQIWNDMMEHGDYDAWWQARTPLPHLNDVNAAVLVVGGFFDAQDLYGPLKTFGAIDRQSPETENFLVMGPWWHGGWARGDGDRYGDLYFGQAMNAWYQEEIEGVFFNHYLKGEERLELDKATIFITGDNEWRVFDAWPPREARQQPLYLRPENSLGFDAPTGADDYAEYMSDPDKPVPHTPRIVINRDDRYVIQDQRFAATRPDVLVFESEPLEEPLTVAGELFANLFVSTTGTDADFIVKLIDVYPDDYECALPDEECSVPMGGFQQLVRGEVMRAKYRNSWEHPEALVPGEVTNVRFDMQDVGHTFLPGHKIMVQIQSTWFPMVDRNPQTFTDIYSATEEDYQKAAHRVYFSREHPSHLELSVLE